MINLINYLIDWIINSPAGCLMIVIVLLIINILT